MVPLRAQYTPGEIPLLATSAQEHANASFNKIAALPPGERTFENTLLAFDTAMTDYTGAIWPLTLMGYVYPDPQVSAEGMAVEESSAVFMNDIYSRRGLYDALRTVSPRTPAEARLFNLTLREFERNGLKLPDERLEKVRKMNDELSGLESRFSANLNNDNTTLVFTATELAGVPAGTLGTFTELPDGTYRVTTKYPDYIAVMKYASLNTTRKMMYMAYNNRQAVENTAILEQAILLRQSIAKELGYRTWADYRTDGRMAQNSSRVMAFLGTIREPLKEKCRVEDAELLLFKKETDPLATSVDPWDVSYLEEIQKLRKFDYDENAVKEYFPADSTVQGIFGIYGKLFGIRFEEVTGAPVWSPDVRLYRALNATGGETVGYLYLDLYPREGKYGHFATFPLISGRMKDGAWSVPVTAIIGNFPAPQGDKPGLLTMDDIETLFHEGGHAMHYLLTTVPYGTWSGFSTELDFVETPSQTLEEWAWDPVVLDSLSSHYTNSSKKLPPELRDRVIAGRDAGIGQYYGRILANSLEDMEYHTADGPVDVTAVSRRIYSEVTGISQPEGIHQPASFVHLMSGYDAGYYGYLWSKVYALEIADEFRRDGMTNQTTGMRLRNQILSQGNMHDGGVLLERFLGHEPGTAAFYQRLGITGVSGTGSP
ncbi:MULTISPECIES: M3 family metallopeptidase [unclassified Methanoregula]|uniref:M3 family metallopeptidase n=1 Tax=unclassified Methanoregula TaxID=2649730 RepID=UPI0025D5A868|nr:MULTISPECIES: M3 family metallopeptidase [unclassified Methanoregula]